MAFSKSRIARWLDDDESETCMNPNCNMLFSVVLRRHHCRRCGLLFCDLCTSTRCLIPRDFLVSPPGTSGKSPTESWTHPQRVCNICYLSLNDSQSDLRQELSKANHETFIERDGPDRYFNPPVSYSMDNEIRKATYSLLNLTKDNAIEGEDSIPQSVLVNAKGIVFLTIFKLGFMLTGRVGTGLVMSRLEDGSWSAPSAIGLSGVGWGFQVGSELSDVMLILNTQEAVNAFTSDTQIAFGSTLGISVGPVGRSAGTDLHMGKEGVSAAFSYAHTKGLFIGISLEASGIISRPEVNRVFYGHDVTPAALLSGEYPKPLGAGPLYRALEEVFQSVADRGSVAVSSSSRRPLKGGATRTSDPTQADDNDRELKELSSFPSGHRPMTRSPVISMSDDEEVDDGGISSPSEDFMISRGSNLRWDIEDSPAASSKARSIYSIPL